MAFTWPRLQNAFKSQGAFGWYAAWNIVGFFLVLWFLPETKGLTLEELDDVFSVSLRKHARFRTKEFINGFQKHVLRRKVEPLNPLYMHTRMAVTSQKWNEKTDIVHEEGGQPKAEVII